MSLLTTTLATLLLAPDPFPSTTWLPKMKDAEITVMDIAILQDNKVTYQKTLGSNQTPVFQVGFLSRIPGLIAFLQLVDQGKINLNSPISTYLPKESMPTTPYKDSILVKHLLNGTSGYDLYKYDGYPPETKSFNLLTEFSHHQPTAAPGTKHQSSAINETIIQLIIENVTGKSLAQVAQEKVFNPLSITQSQYSLLPPKGQTLAKGNKPLRVYPQANAQGLYTTAHDLAVILNEILSCANGKQNGLLSPKTAKLTITPDEEGKTYGFNTNLTDPSKTFFLGGQNPGYSCQIHFRLTPTPHAVIVLTNTNMGWNLMNEVFATGFDYINKKSGL